MTLLFGVGAKTAAKWNFAGQIGFVISALTGLAAALVAEGIWISTLTLATAGLVLVCTLITFWAAAIEARDSDQKIAQANSLASAANARAEEAGLANTELTLTLERERAERMSLERRLGPRTLTPDQIDIVVSSLRTVGTTGVEVDFINSGGAEGEQFCRILAGAFIVGGARTRTTARTIIVAGGADQYGLRITLTGGPGSDIVGEIFERLKLGARVKRLEPPAANGGPARTARWSASATVTVFAKAPHL